MPFYGHVTQHAKRFSSILDSMKDVGGASDQMSFFVNADGIVIQKIDSVHSNALARMILRSDRMHRFDLDREYAMTLQGGTLSRALKPCTNNSQLEMRIDDEGDEQPLRLQLRIHNDGEVHEVSLRALNTPPTRMATPATVFDWSWQMPAANLQRFINHVSTSGHNSTDNVSLVRLEMCKEFFRLRWIVDQDEYTTTVTSCDSVSLVDSSIDAFDRDGVQQQCAPKVDAEQSRASARRLMSEADTALDGDTTSASPNGKRARDDERGARTKRARTDDDTTFVEVTPELIEGGSGVAPPLAVGGGVSAAADGAASDPEASPEASVPSEVVSNLYHVKVLRTFVKVAICTETVYVLMRPEFPVFLIFPIANIGHVVFVLTPYSDDADVA